MFFSIRSFLVEEKVARIEERNIVFTNTASAIRCENEMQLMTRSLFVALYLLVFVHFSLCFMF